MIEHRTRRAVLQQLVAAGFGVVSAGVLAGVLPRTSTKRETVNPSKVVLRVLHGDTWIEYAIDQLDNQVDLTIEREVITDADGNVRPGEASWSIQGHGKGWPTRDVVPA